MAVELGYEINSLSGLITRGLNEMITYAKSTKGKVSTLIGLTGVGDLLLTSMSDKSRNRQFGRRFIKEGKKSLDSKITTEGVSALKHIYEIGKEKDLHLPIVNGLYSIIFKGAKPENLVNKLISSTNNFE